MIVLLPRWRRKNDLISQWSCSINRTVFEQEKKKTFHSEIVVVPKVCEVRIFKILQNPRRYYFYASLCEIHSEFTFFVNWSVFQPRSEIDLLFCHFSFSVPVRFFLHSPYGIFPWNSAMLCRFSDVNEFKRFRTIFYCIWLLPLYVNVFLTSRDRLGYHRSQKKKKILKRKTFHSTDCIYFQYFIVFVFLPSPPPLR